VRLHGKGGASVMKVAKRYQSGHPHFPRTGKSGNAKSIIDLLFRSM
jgi:phosphotransferase system HPr-like phosphotransfer protein